MRAVGIYLSCKWAIAKEDKIKRYILVTGHASGIGRHAATQLHQRGFNVTGIDKVISAELDESIRQIWCDLSNWKEAKYAFSQIDSLDYAVNCVGVSGVRKIIPDITSEELINSYHQIFLPAFHACKLEAESMLNNVSVAKIVNIASSTASMGSRGMVAYSSAKAAIVNLTKSSLHQRFWLTPFLPLRLIRQWSAKSMQATCRTTVRPTWRGILER